MKSSRKNLFFLASISVALTAPSAFGVNLYWDTDGAGAGTATPTGAWGTLGTTWSTDSTGATATSALTTAGIDDLFFSAGAAATGSYTVTLGASQNANSLTFEEGAVTLSGNTINLAAGGITVAAGAGDAIIGSALTATGTRTYDVGAGRILTLNGIVTSTITKTGSGTMTLGTGAVHVIGGWTVNGGTLNLGLSGTGDNLPGGIVNSGGTVKLNGGNSKVNNSNTFTINAGGTFDINASTDLVGGMIGAGSISIAPPARQVCIPTPMAEPALSPE